MTLSGTWRNGKTQVYFQPRLANQNLTNILHTAGYNCTCYKLKFTNVWVQFPCQNLTSLTPLVSWSFYQARGAKSRLILGPGNEILCISAHTDRWYHPLCLPTVTCTSSFDCNICRKWPIDDALLCSFFCFQPGRHRYKK
jgi:hypothetical protein